MANLTFEEKKFIFRGIKDERFPAKEAGFLFNPAEWKDPHWSSIYLEKVKQLIENCREMDIALEIKDSAKKEVRRLEALEKEKLELSRGTEAEVDIPVPDGLDYFAFQRAGIKYALSTDNVLIADEMGLGKTIQAIGVINKEKPKKVLIIVPATLRLNWMRELKRWLVDDYSISMIDGKANFKADIVVINYDRLVKHKEELLSYSYDLLILDESHYVKNYKAKRTRAARDIAHKAKKRIFLTGTPVLNRPIELFTPLCILRSDIVKKGWLSYVTRYCAGWRSPWGWDVSGASNTEELNKKLRGSVMVRRLKKDVLTELPSKIHSMIPIEAKGNEICSALAEEREKRDRWMLIRNELKKMKQRLDIRSEEERREEFETQMKGLRGEIAVAFTEIAAVRHKTALAKVPEAIKFIGNILELQDKVIVYTHHKDVLEEIYRVFSSVSVKLTGDTSMKDRDVSIERFQNDDSVKLFLGTIQTAGLGITLTASSTVVFVELEWTPSEMAQAEDRCHRIGQKEVVNVYHLVVDDSIDAELSNMLIEKQEIITQILDEEIEVEEIDLNNVETSKSKVTSTLDKIAEELTAENREGIHRLLIHMAARCDGAFKEDAQGFNKLDTRVGKELAAASVLSNRQAALGYLILRKYRRQLEWSDDYKKIFNRRCE